MPNMFRDGKQYGYRFTNRFSGDVICDRTFDSREEMEAALVEDLSPEALLGKFFAQIPAENADRD